MLMAVENNFLNFIDTENIINKFKKSALLNKELILNYFVILGLFSPIRLGGLSTSGHLVCAVWLRVVILVIS